MDLQGQVVQETGLLAAPVRRVTARLAELLEEWPEHPILSQLAAICGRLTGEGMHGASNSRALKLTVHCFRSIAPGGDVG